MDKNKIFITIAAVVGVFVFVIAAYYATNKPKPAVVYEQLKKVAKNDDKQCKRKYPSIWVLATGRI